MKNLVGIIVLAVASITFTSCTEDSVEELNNEKNEQQQQKHEIYNIDKDDIQSPGDRD